MFTTQRSLKVITPALITASALAMFSDIHPPQVHAQPEGRVMASYSFPLFSTFGKVQARLNCPSDNNGLSDPTKVRLFFDVLQPILASAQEGTGAEFNDNPPARCMRYAFMSRQDCEMELKPGEAASYPVNLANLQNGDYLIRAGIIIIGSNGKRGMIRNPMPSLELTEANGTTQILGPFLAGPQPDPPGVQ